MSGDARARTIALASGNPHKAREWEALLPGWSVRTLDMRAAPPEAGETFWENALAKARYGAGLAEDDVWVLGEDSGLAVEALAGAPGVLSARYAGAGASDGDNVARLLAELGDGEDRQAAFHCLVACLPPRAHGTVKELRAEGTLAGAIARAPAGGQGFGYDPVFVPAGEVATIAQLGEEWKRVNSHRARAADALLAAIDRW